VTFKGADLSTRSGVESATIAMWIEAGWLSPLQGRGYSEADVARARLVRDLREDLGINDEGIGVVLDLIDQVHGLRHLLETLTCAVREQSPTVHQRIVAAAQRFERLDRDDAKAVRSTRLPAE
jgi:chaperone modulatory protein CbpM